MPFAQPGYSKADVDAAGDALIAASTPDEVPEHALTVINNWRSSHNYPLNTFQMWLRKNAKRADQQSLVVQRIKRLSSIDLKLRRFKNWPLKLSEIQDIGGCRAVLRSVASVNKLVFLYKNSRLRHALDHEDDYIKHPKKSGYRGVHLIYRYYSRKKRVYKGLKIEVQLRSTLQHAWATAVETVDTFTAQALKSGGGDREWRRFFALMGSELAAREGTEAVPKIPMDRSLLVSELREYANRLNVAGKLGTYGAVIQQVEKSGIAGAHYFLVTLDPEGRRVTVTGFPAKEAQKAAKEYLATERSIAGRPGADAVLVSAESLTALTRAYPNYFLDTSLFLVALRTAIGGNG